MRVGPTPSGRDDERTRRTNGISGRMENERKNGYPKKKAHLYLSLSLYHTRSYGDESGLHDVVVLESLRSVLVAGITP